VNVDLEQQTFDLVSTRFPDQLLGEGSHAGQRWIDVRRERIVEILKTLHDQIPFEMLMDVTAVDWLDQGRPERFSVVYQLYSVSRKGYARIKAWVPEADASIASASGIWAAAIWGEREVYDMYGITFDGHPALERILLPETYPGFPLRKDYPLTGQGERYDFPKHTR
jgi:NADH-quinone oxidoreductase subunit C